MTDVWKLDNEYYCLYTENKDIMKSIRRYYNDFEIMAEYWKFGKLKGMQYKVPIKRKRSAFHLAKKGVYLVQNEEENHRIKEEKTVVI
ncbi:hypothetical protein [Ammoniphilus resinae]|uniref:Uncharacterized protein n=1 Tax=Ammoniphilus resinae TaxID=861532 RepID=A0ABS4GRQ0_9BACL|nr:hypothetical protein [Ammoniphilus resinae]MBP1932944.1 hypothetical protein [Ammoniphilus resinae]